MKFWITYLDNLLIEELYTYFTFIYSKKRAEDKQKRKHPSILERKIIHRLYHCGIVMDDLAQLLGRSTDTISRWGNYDFKDCSNTQKKGE